MKKWSERLKDRMKELNITEEELAQKMGITRGAVNHYLSGRRAPPLKGFQKLAAILKSDPAWLQYGIPEGKPPITKAEIEKERTSKKAVPLISWKNISSLTNTSQIAKEDVERYLEHFYTDQPSWYALQVKGDSMTAPTGYSKSFHDGDILIINPKLTAIHGSYVIALLPKSKEATFKQYVIDGGSHYLKPLNPQYPIVEIDKNTLICGVVVYCLS